MIRSVLGVAVGAVFWTVGFYALAVCLGLLWPDYSMHGRHWVKEGTFTFTPVMAGCNVAFWVLAEIGAGWLAQKISRRPVAVWILAGLIGIYLATLHFIWYWDRFPWWYNLGVVFTAVPAVLLGAYFAEPSQSRKNPA